MLLPLLRRLPRLIVLLVLPLAAACGAAGASSGQPAAGATPAAGNPAAGTGRVTGTLVNINTKQPAYATILYLEVALNHDVPAMVYGPLNHQPQTTSLKDGSFSITDVPPGEYVLILYSPIDIYFWEDTDGRARLIQVQADQTVDLGQVVSMIP